jgi:hypothetical protein
MNPTRRMSFQFWAINSYMVFRLPLKTNKYQKVQQLTSDFMSPKAKILSIYPQGHSSVYNYVCRGEEGLFRFTVEWRYHRGILENEGDPVGREVEYNDGIEPQVLRFLG